MDPLHQVPVFSVLRAPELDAGLQVGSHQSRVRAAESPPSTCWPHFFRCSTGFLGCKCTLPVHVQLFIHRYPQVLLGRAVLNAFIPQTVLISGLALTQVQNLSLGLVELHEVLASAPLQLMQVPLDGLSSCWYVNCTTQLGVISKLAGSALHPFLDLFPPFLPYVIVFTVITQKCFCKLH